MRIVFMGTPGFAVPTLEHLFRNHVEVAAVYTAPDRPAGRGRHLQPSPVKQAARARGLTVLQPEGFKAEAAVRELAELQPDAVVVAAYGTLLPRTVLEIPPCGCLNVHPSLLPRFRGASPISGAILAGDEFTGVSIMLLDAGMDTGPVFTRAQVPVFPRDTAGSLGDRLARVAAPLLLEVLIRWGRREITPAPQAAEQATYSGPLRKEDSEIDWTLPAVELWRRVRAYNPAPESFTRWQGQPLKVLEAVPLPGMPGARAGQVVALTGGGAAFGVGTGEGVLGIISIKPAGKRAMNAADFLRGQRDFIGAVLGGEGG
ncbi:MAG: methionyl-tRNA formyltransferase [Chloroflexota bacterium]